MAKAEKLIYNNTENKDVLPTESGNPPIKLAVQQVPETVKPVKVRRIEAMDIPEMPEPVNGKYYLVALDAKGNEVPESGFMIGKRTYENVYSKSPDKFRVKKNPKL